MESSDKGRYHCKFSGCEKSFQRREHLARHAQTHTQSRYICKVCQKVFTRSDSLKRHLGLHGEEYKTAPSRRSKRACVTCHSSKIKCDGDQPCSRCNKKIIDCRYDPPPENDAAVSGAPAPSNSVLESREDSHCQSLADSSTAPINCKSSGETQASFAERFSAAFAKSGGPIDWSAARIRNDLPHNASFGASNKVTQSEAENWPSLPESEMNKYSDQYFTHFHHRWPILHAPTYEAETAHPVLLSCVAMIGARIHGTSDSMQFAMSLYTSVVDWIFPRLCQISSENSIDDSSTLSLCQASLLYIIFGFYYGKGTVLSTAIMIHSMLVTALRELGLFEPEEPSSYDNPGYFVPLKLVKEGQKQRLSTCLFKIDSYLNILRNQPDLLKPEELHFTLPCTFALWNSNGLNIFEIRHSIEPGSRSNTTICRTIRNNALESFTPIEGLMLVEDIQLGICAMHAKMWQLAERTRDNPEKEVSNTIERDALRRRLEAWKHWLLRSPIQQTDHIDFSKEQNFAMRYYYGIEDHTQPGWQSIVFDRPKDLIFDTLMLYDLLSLHLYTDVRTLTRIAKSKVPVSPASVLVGKFLKASERRDDSTRIWAESASARRALCHATDILVSYNNISRFENNGVDPIAYVALSVAALVVWAYCIFGGKGCPDCIWEGQLLPLIDGPIIELTKWGRSRNSQLFEKDRETWIEMGGCRGALTGLVLCSCNIDLVVAKFRSCIRSGWNIADSIAPGIFKS